MSGIQQLLLGGSPAGGYQIERSLRFNSADSAYLNRTPASAGNRKTWTWSGWVKIANLGTDRKIFSTSVASTPFSSIYLGSDDRLTYYEYTGSNYVVSPAQLFRDPSAWYHIVIAYDSAQATASNRTLMYVNGVVVTAFNSSSYVPQNTSSQLNSAVVTYIAQAGNSSGYFDGYMTEVNFIDGQALTPSDFGETDSATGVWKPKKFSGTYGTNGFYLNFSDNSNTTSTTLGKDSSGNGNNWTPNNFSVTAGAGNDSLVDTPTSYGSDTGVGGEVRGNYATLNPLAKSSVGTLDNGNLQWTSGNSGGGTAGNGTRASIGMNVGKWYTEVTRLDTVFWSYPGISNESHLTSTYNGGDANSWSIDGSGQKTTNNSSSAYGSASWAANDIINIAYDADNGELYFGKNGTWLNSGNPATRTNPAFTSLSGTLFFTVGFSANTASASSVVFNFGQRPFAYTAPSGFKALCTQNLPTPTIGATSTTQAGKYFGINLWTGNGSTGSRAITGLGFKPDWVWWKNRTTAKWHQVFDSNRGADKALSTNATDTEDASGGYGGEGSVTSFDSDGYTLQGGVGNNENNSAIVGWAWQAGQGTNSTNTSGTITSTVSANTTAGFSIVTYTGTGANATVGHGLGVAPSMVIYKNRDALQNWMVATTVIDGSNDYLFLNTTAAKGDSADSAPTSTLLNLTTYGHNNGASQKIVAYCFAPVAGYSAFGSYTGNGSTDGPFVFLNFRPKFIFWKNASTTGDWQMKDATRSTYNVTSANLYANLSNAENSAGDVDFLSNGFKIRSAGTDVNGSGNTIIYAAFAESPFKYSLAR